MTDNKKDEEIAEQLEKDIAEGGIKASEETFSLLPGKEHVFFLIKGLPGDPKKVLAMQLPATMAVSLGNALVNCAILSVTLNEEDSENGRREVEPLKKELLN